MSDNHYSIYKNNVFSLANTLTIKLNYNIEAINEYLHLYHPHTFNPQDPKTWKYYLNVSGQYHSTDTKMIVKSLDTLEDIIFSKENLAIHRSTNKAYQYGTRYYRELVVRYPYQENIILGVLNPVDIDMAISAKEGKILSYGKGLIEVQEYSLLENLQHWVDGYLYRWVNDKFAIAHDLYHITTLAVMYSMLPQTILQYRHEKSNTIEAHSFHIKEYLKSNGRLDKYYSKMTLKQALWLCRNIRYIKKYLGRRFTFEKLIENILTQRGISLSEYTATHDTDRIIENL